MEKEQQPQYSYDAVIPSWLLISKEIPERAKLLYARIRALAKKEGYCYATNKFLSNETGVSERTIRTYLELLKKTNLIDPQVKPRKGGGWERRIWLGETCGKPRKQVANTSAQAEADRRGASGQAEAPPIKKCQQVVDISKDIITDDEIKNNLRRYRTMTAGLLDKFAMTDHRGHTEAQEEVAAETRTSGQKSWQERNEETRAFKAEQEKYRNATI